MNTHPIRILMIEDDPDDVFLIREYLSEAKNHQFHIEMTEKLEDGLAHLTSENIDIVLSDLTLPDSYGLDTFVKLQEQASHVPIIVLSGLDDESIAVEAVHRGAQDYLVKSQLDSRLLVRAIQYAIERKHAEIRLRENEKQMSNFFALSTDMFCIAGFDGYFKALNPSWEKTLGFALEELKAQPFSAYIHPEDQEKTHESVRQLSLGNERPSLWSFNHTKKIDKTLPGQTGRYQESPVPERENGSKFLSGDFQTANK